MRHTDYTIHPFEGVGAVKFGMTPEEVHEIWGEPEQTLLRNPDAYISHADIYSKLGISVEYDESGVCYHIGFSSCINNCEIRDPEENGYDSDEDDLSHDYTSDEINVQISYDKCDEKAFRKSNLTDLAAPIITMEVPNHDGTYLINPTFQGREFYGQTMKELKSWLKSLGTAIQPTDYGYVFLGFGIGAYAQDYSPFDKFDFLVETLTVSSAECVNTLAELILEEGEYPREESIPPR